MQSGGKTASTAARHVCVCVWVGREGGKDSTGIAQVCAQQREKSETRVRACAHKWCGVVWCGVLFCAHRKWPVQPTLSDEQRVQ